MNDVTRGAHRYLFEPVTIDPAVTLGDIFGLIGASPSLMDVFARYHAKELVEEVGDKNAGAASPSDEIEFLELYQIWNLDSGELQPNHHLYFRGVGFALQDDVIQQGSVLYGAGERIAWNLSLTSPRDILHLPLRINPDVVICEEGEQPAIPGKAVPRIDGSGITLGQVIHGVLAELSFYGSPASREQAKARISGQDDDSDSHDGR
jgi:hypothetical protein